MRDILTSYARNAYKKVIKYKFCNFVLFLTIKWSRTQTFWWNNIQVYVKIIEKFVDLVNQKFEILPFLAIVNRKEGEKINSEDSIQNYSLQGFLNSQNHLKTIKLRFVLIYLIR